MSDVSETLSAECTCILFDGRYGRSGGHSQREEPFNLEVLHILLVPVWVLHELPPIQDNWARFHYRLPGYLGRVCFQQLSVGGVTTVESPLTFVLPSVFKDSYVLLFCFFNIF